MEDTLRVLLESYGYMVRRQGSMPSNFPDTFITYWNTESPDHAHYDNRRYGTSWSFNIFVYSIDPELVYSLISSIRDLLIENGWVVSSRGYDAASDEPTHVGRAINAQFLEI